MAAAATRRSRKRDAILRTLCGTKDHPTAENLHAALKGVLPNLSLGTVYANLAAFKQNGTAVTVAVVNGKERFDGNTEPHAHFICRGCGTVMDLDVPLPPSPSLNARIESCHLNWYGLCGECQ